MNLQPTVGGAPERHVVQEIECFLKLNGWKVWQLEQQRHMKKGTADMIAGKNGKAIFIECKRRAGPWTDKYGKIKNLRGGQQRPGQAKFQAYWTGALPYVLADRWEAVHEAVKKIETIKQSVGNFVDVYGGGPK